jgi:hypothetical protein
MDCHKHDVVNAIGFNVTHIQENDSMLILKSEMACFKLGVLGCDAIG